MVLGNGCCDPSPTCQHQPYPSHQVCNTNLACDGIVGTYTKLECLGLQTCRNANIDLSPGGELICDSHSGAESCEGNIYVNCLGDCTILCQGEEACFGNTYFTCADGHKCCSEISHGRDGGNNFFYGDWNGANCYTCDDDSSWPNEHGCCSNDKCPSDCKYTDVTCNSGTCTCTCDNCGVTSTTTTEAPGECSNGEQRNNYGCCPDNKCPPDCSFTNYHIQGNHNYCSCSGCHGGSKNKTDDGGSGGSAWTWVLIIFICIVCIIALICFARSHQKKRSISAGEDLYAHLNDRNESIGT